MPSKSERNRIWKTRGYRGAPLGISPSAEGIVTAPLGDLPIGVGEYRRGLPVALSLLYRRARV
ncbi:MAG: hypothetical protein IPK82_17945 [Polyangiaceae bacterium]|nr:hypothetical protein [Polyangiaceae bacterium]